jgi:hypothetical protein
MKYFFAIALIVALATGCSKNDCIQCARQVKATTQTSTVYTDYIIVYAEFCGKQADTAMAQDVTTYSYFVTEHNLVANTCFYNQ